MTDVDVVLFNPLLGAKLGPAWLAIAGALRDGQPHRRNELIGHALVAADIKIKTAECLLYDAARHDHRDRSRPRTTSRAPMTVMPDHVVRYLTNLGVIDTAGYTRRARPRTCRCGRLVIAGLDHDRCAIRAIVDPTPLAPTGELAALLAGRTTYALHADRGAYLIDFRTSFHIDGSPAGTLPRGDVVAAHQCGSTALSATHSHIPAPAGTRTYTDACPF